MLVALCAAGCGAGGVEALASSSGSALFGPFAGYIWDGDVHQISAVIVVPAVDKRSPDGVAGSWIGAEADATLNPDSRSAPFFQVGVNEARLPVSGEPAHDFYYAFWSSAALGFRPKMLFQVKPGDAVRLAMTLSQGHWSISAADRRSGASSRFPVTSSGLAGFIEASWQQEDVTSQSTSEPLPYPDLGAVRFSQLRVNLHDPAPGSLQESWMSSDRGTYGPAALQADSFVVHRLRVSAEALRFQRIAVAEDLQAAVFNSGLQRWSASTSSRIIRAVSLTFARALKQNIARFRAEHWSRDVRKPMAALIRTSERFREVVLRLAAHGPSYLTQARIGFFQDDVHAFALKVRARLHMPVTDLSGLAVAKYVRTHSSR